MQDMVILLRQFATLVEASVPLIPCCELLEKSQPKLLLRRLVYQIKSQLLTGQSLYTCIQAYPLYFNHFTTKLIQIGEQTGQLNKALLTIADYHEKKMLLKKQIQQALFYPCLLLLTTLTITLGLFLFVIPHFAALFADTKTQLPALTRCLFTIAAWLKLTSLPLILLAGAIILFFIYHTHKRSKWTFVKTFILNLPILSSFWRKLILMQFLKNLSLGLRAGIAMTEALSLTINIHYPSTVSEAIAKLRQHISTGLSLHHSMGLVGWFPPLVIQMTKIGEESGMLENMLEKTAAFFEIETNQQLSHLTTLIEPIIILVVGVLIGGLVIGMYLPIFKLGSTL